MFRLSVKVPIIFNILAINPNKFLAVFSFMMATVSMLISFVIFTLNYCSITSIVFIQVKNGIHVDVSGWYVLTLAVTFLFCFCISLPLTLFLSRRDPQQYAQILSGGVRISHLIKLTSTEIYRIVTQTNYNDKEGALDKIQRLPNAFEIVSELTLIISRRLKIKPEHVREKIFQFDAEVFINRQNQKFYNQATSHKKDEKEKRAKKIISNLDKTEAYLKKLNETQLNFDHLEFMFQTRSVSSAMQHYIKFIETHKELLLAETSDTGEFALLKQIQKSYKDGAVNYRAIGQVLSENASGSLNERAALARLKCLSLNSGVWATHDEDAEYLNDWSEQSVNHVYDQRDIIVNLFPAKLQEIIADNQSNPKNAKKYIVLFDYSRAVRTALTSIISDDNYEIVCLRHNESRSDFGSRLMHHQITKEHPNDELSSEDISKNVAMVTFQQFYSEFDKEKDAVVYVCGCDFIENDRAYLFLSPDIPKEIKEKTKVEKLDVLVVAGSYKYRLHELAEHFKRPEKSEEELKKSIELLAKILPPKRRFSSNLWQSDSEMKVHILSSSKISSNT